MYGRDAGSEPEHVQTMYEILKILQSIDNERVRDELMHKCIDGFARHHPFLHTVRKGTCSYSFKRSATEFCNFSKQMLPEDPLAQNVGTRQEMEQLYKQLVYLLPLGDLCKEPKTSAEISKVAFKKNYHLLILALATFLISTPLYYLMWEEVAYIFGIVSIGLALAFMFIVLVKGKYDYYSRRDAFTRLTIERAKRLDNLLLDLRSRKTPVSTENSS